MAKRKKDLRKHSTGAGMVVGVAWYDAEQWAKLKAIAPDADELEETHEDWLKMAEQALTDLAELGIVPRRVSVDVDELRRWCREQKRPVDGSARAAFAAEKLTLEDPRGRRGMEG